MSQLEIQILHQEYLLTCPDGHEPQLLEAVERVDQQFQKMRDNSKLRSRERIGVLLAVNLAYENLELRNQLQALQQQVAHIQNPVDSAQIEIDAERLAALETQATIDQQTATSLLQRLDEVLTAQSSAAESSTPPDAHDATVTLETEDTVADAIEPEITPEFAQTQLVEAKAISNTDLENLQDVSFAPASSESL